MKCRRCRTDLTARQVYRRQKFCSIACANARGHGSARLGSRWRGVREWQRVLALLSEAWFVTLSDIALWRYGDDTPADINAARQSICRIRREGHALEQRDLPWPTSARRAIRGYRLIAAEARKEGAA